jgi:mono/diheme cytochrome c family protein
MATIPSTRRVAGVVLVGITLTFSVWIGSAMGRTRVDQALPPSYIPSGMLMYKQYCATCHGIDAKGHGPYASMLKVPPADLTTLAKRHDGKFPYDYVSNVLRFGPSPTVLHGSADMPAWGPISLIKTMNGPWSNESRISAII